MAGLSQRLKRLEQTVAMASLNRVPSMLEYRRQRQIEYETICAIHQDPKAGEAAWCVAETMAAVCEANPDWAFGKNVQTIGEVAIRANPKARAASEYLTAFQGRVVAARGI